MVDFEERDEPQWEVDPTDPQTRHFDPNHPERIYLTDEECRTYELDPEMPYHWDAEDRTLIRLYGRYAKFLEAQTDEQREGRKRKTKGTKVQKDSAKKLLTEELNIEWDEATERERILALNYVIGSSADRKLWSDHVTKRRGPTVDGHQVLPLQLGEETEAALINALEVIRDIQRERNTAADS